MRVFSSSILALGISALTGAVTPSEPCFPSLASRLSDSAEIHFPGSAQFDSLSRRWSNFEKPNIQVAVVVATEEDVAETVKFAVEYDLPFLAHNGRHGTDTSLGKLQNGIGIFLNKLVGVEISSDGETATIAGGTGSKVVTDTLLAADKETVTGACECVSYLGPALGGGHGFLQGRHGLISDQFVSANIVLADGTLTTIDADSDLWWAVKGAGHNFGIVTSVTAKIYPQTHHDWALETFTFTGDKVEAAYEAANKLFFGKEKSIQPVDVIQWSFWFNFPDIDPTGPLILFYIMQQGVTSVSDTYAQPFRDLGPIANELASGTYTDLPAWTLQALDSLGCEEGGQAKPRFPIYLRSFNTTAQRQAYDLFASSTGPDTPFGNSLLMFEGYSLQGIRAVPDDHTAFAFRGDNLVVAPLIQYELADERRDAEAKKLGEELRELLRQGSQRSELHAYVNYAYGDEDRKALYGYEDWRQERLRGLKEKYDPHGRFSFFGSIHVA
ncbi:hypothetical protein QBC34DRAFT_468775 [Podospora aff. communis PSN243]|uniref:FAD-binding PCMH-type domain-containing protein n=1 Tax=Podospora aff. communis PSN243 TaxID=3040156 RepID=A0AAV9GFS6_9PEZI|nr:hypothetical protein QBC34DRAFT_468775 [Podospora aff. communis PSN243]